MENTVVEDGQLYKADKKMTYTRPKNPKKLRDLLHLLQIDRRSKEFKVDLVIGYTSIGQEVQNML